MSGECTGLAVLVGHNLQRRHPRAYPQRAVGQSLLPEFSLQKNADGSVDLYFAPKAPVGKDSNWVPTDPNGKFKVLFRFYGPKKPLFEQSVGAAGYQRLN